MNEKLFSDLEILSKIMETGSFVGAAKKLNVSQATISRKINSLEEEFGSTLVKRSTRGLEFTPVAHELNLIYQDLLSNFVNAIRPLKHQTNVALSGKLKIALPPIIGTRAIAPYLGQFLIRHPEIYLEVNLLNREIDFIKEDYDLALVNRLPTQQTVKIRQVYKVKAQLYCSKEYKERYGIPTTIEECRNHIIIGGKFLKDFSFGHSNKTDASIPSGLFKPYRIRSDSPLFNREVILAGHIIGTGWNGMFSEEIANGDVICVLPEFANWDVRIYLARVVMNNPLIDTFIEFINECMLRFE